MISCDLGDSVGLRRVAPSPLSFGILRSSTIKSGCSSFALRTDSNPSEAFGDDQQVGTVTQHGLNPPPENSGDRQAFVDANASDPSRPAKCIAIKGRVHYTDRLRSIKFPLRSGGRPAIK
jgi:hypothetical protein